jgi:hypothetical protein
MKVADKILATTGLHTINRLLTCDKQAAIKRCVDYGDIHVYDFVFFDMSKLTLRLYF